MKEFFVIEQRLNGIPANSSMDLFFSISDTNDFEWHAFSFNQNRMFYINIMNVTRNKVYTDTLIISAHFLLFDNIPFYLPQPELIRQKEVIKISVFNPDIVSGNFIFILTGYKIL